MKGPPHDHRGNAKTEIGLYGGLEPNDRAEKILTMILCGIEEKDAGHVLVDAESRALWDAMSVSVAQAMRDGKTISYGYTDEE